MSIYRIKNNQIQDAKQSLTIKYANGVYSYGESEEELLNPYELVESYPQSYIKKLAYELEEAKNIKLWEINAKTDGQLKGFVSNALGENHIYDLDLEDQLNLMGLMVANIDSLFRCARQSQPAIKEYFSHTKEQIKQVYTDGVEYKSTILFKSGELKARLQQATTLEEINAIVWDS